MAILQFQVIPASTVTPADAGQSSDVSISTDLPVRTGPLGLVERLVTTRVLQPLYKEELRRLTAFITVK